MEYTIHETGILDPTLADKFENLILKDILQFKEEKIYRIVATFDVSLLENLSVFDKFILPTDSERKSKRKKNYKKDKMYEVLSFQLKQLEKILEKNNIELCFSTIQGDQLESTSIIKIEINQDTSEPKVGGKGRITSTIMPNKPYTEGLIREFRVLQTKRLSKLYCVLFNAVGNNKSIMSEILDIEETDDDNLLFQAFVKEFREAWLSTKDKDDEKLIEKFKNKAIKVIEKFENEGAREA